MNKKDIAQILADIAVLLELRGDNPFKIRAYQSGARTLETLEEDLSLIIAEDRLDQVKGIGKALRDKIVSLHETGYLEFYENLKASIPQGMIDMLEIPGMGPKKIKKLSDELGIVDIEGLAKACQEDRVSELKGFGKKTQEKILSGIKNREAYMRRYLWADAFTVAEPVLKGLKALPEVQMASHAGSLRRKCETVGDLDFLVASNNPRPIMDWFTTLPEIQEVTAKGQTKSSIRFESGLQADLRVVPAEQFYYALHHFTGSKDHNVAMRSRALTKGLSLSEWGLAPKDAEGKMNASLSRQIASEAELFEALGLEFIEPELREGFGELEAAERGILPKLICYKDIQGCFHNHTEASDGRNTLEEIHADVTSRGWAYVGIADHSKSSFQANGLDEGRLLAQVEAIRMINERGQGAWIFSGSEVDILKDGSLDFADDILSQLDYVVASVHTAFTLSEKEMTARLIKAIENPYVKILGHLTGRLLLRRESYALNVDAIIDAAVANGVSIELNANPKRLDMDWRHWKRARDKGVICSINPDAHNLAGFNFVENGVHIARKGWLEKEHILNTRPLEEVKAFFHA